MKSVRSYTKPLVLKSFFIFFLFSCSSQTETELQSGAEPQVVSSENDSIEKPLILGAERMGLYLPMLESKKVGFVGNQTSAIGKTHLVDTLKQLGVNLQVIFSPEHGFRGEADAGEKVSSGIDQKTGIKVVSLYGNNKKPKAEDISGLDVVVFDIQDVGARFYTYISTLHYVMETCAEQNVPLLVLDRPNPNGHYVDGPVLKKEYTSFVGMHSIPIVHGMTIGEYAQMINGEAWLKNGAICSLEVITCENYNRDLPYSLPVPPSPNLRTDAAIALYPSLCLFEGTVVSEGRGTEKPFEIFGHPKLPADRYPYSFTPKPGFGSKSPKLNGQKCNGLDLSSFGEEGMNELNIDWLIDAYSDFQGDDFFITKNRWFDILAGTDELRKAIVAGKTAEEIRASWQTEIKLFKQKREKYLLY